MTDHLLYRNIIGLLAVFFVCAFSSKGTSIIETPHTLKSAFTPIQQDNKADWQQVALNEIRKRIAGKEDEPAETVFKNIEVLKGKKASRLPGMMQALTGLLGVDCTYCHVKDQWDKEDKPAKQITRKHFQMQAQMNKEYFNGGNAITCWTCHRGQPKPQDLSKKMICYYLWLLESPKKLFSQFSSENCSTSFSSSSYSSPRQER